jgi:hypothetical protein
MSNYSSREETLREFSQTHAYEALKGLLLDRADNHLSTILNPETEESRRRDAVCRIDELQRIIYILEATDPDRPARKKMKRIATTGGGDVRT